MMTGVRKLELIRELALEALSTHELAERFDVSYAYVTAFMREFRMEVERMRASIASGTPDLTSALWIADKTSRVSEYWDDVNCINRDLQGMDYTSNEAQRALRTKHNALHAVAEELNQLPLRAPAAQDASVVHYMVQGVSTEELQSGLT